MVPNNKLCATRLTCALSLASSLYFIDKAAEGDGV